MRAVLFLPNNLLTRVSHNPAPVAEVPESPRDIAEETPQQDQEVPKTTASGLPKRSRRRAREQQAAVAPAASVGTLPEPARRAALGLGAWQRGTRSGRASEGNPET